VILSLNVATDAQFRALQEALDQYVANQGEYVSELDADAPERAVAAENLLHAEAFLARFTERLCALADGHSALDTADLPQRANDHSHRKGAPELAISSDVDTLTAWLVWCDPYGWWPRAGGGPDDLEPLTTEQAWLSIEELLDNA
jgi:hypothetical protein